MVHFSQKVIIIHIKVIVQGILFTLTQAFATCVQINYFCDYKCDYLSCHLVQMTCSLINNYKVVLELHIQLIFATNVNLDENENEK
jgi:hypothetical protein